MQKIYYEITKTMNNLPISIYPHKKSPCKICTAHWHRSLELSIVFEGKVIFFNDGMKRIRYKNEVNISNCEEIHYSIPQYKEFDEKIVGYTMHINYGFLKKMIPDIKNIYFNIDEPFLNKKITQYMMDIYSFYISNQSTRYMNILMVTLEMLIFLYENCKNERKMIKTEKTKDILEYVNNHYNEELLVYEVAKRFGYSREYFSRFFKTEVPTLQSSQISETDAVLTSKSKSTTLLCLGVNLGKAFSFSISSVTVLVEASPTLPKPLGSINLKHSYVVQKQRSLSHNESATNSSLTIGLSPIMLSISFKVEFMAE